ncbi:MAG: non-ribosomal peptide synthetase, partial [Anaerolineales bacterium]|nr:non-ribosomal peptide synthetase [Anaerolineales bacterium]
PPKKQLVAYLIPRYPPGPSASELYRFLKQKLPDYMMPAAFVTLDTMPLTPHGKIDRRGLPAPTVTRLEWDQPFVAPHTSTEQSLAEIWATVLGVERMGVNENFFEAGGHSLLATQVMARIHQAFGFDLPLRCLFEAPTIAEFATLVDQYEVERVDQETLVQMLAELDRLPEADRPGGPTDLI